MSRGPTRRLQALIATGAVTDDDYTAAAVEADLLEHPYVGIEHLDLARLNAYGMTAEYRELRRTLTPGLPRRWWRPRGPRSALRPDGLRATRLARLKAEARHDPAPGTDPPP